MLGTYKIAVVGDHNVGKTAFLQKIFGKDNVKGTQIFTTKNKRFILVDFFEQERIDSDDEKFDYYIFMYSKDNKKSFRNVEKFIKVIPADSKYIVVANKIELGLGFPRYSHFDISVKYHQVSRDPFGCFYLKSILEDCLFDLTKGMTFNV